MKRILMTTAAAVALAGTAQAGGIERSSQSVAILFEQGNYAEISFGSIAPDVSGTQAITVSAGSVAGVGSGDMAGDYSTLSLGVKTALNDRLDLALVIDEPIGANVAYPVTGYLYGGSTASIDSVAATALLRYRLPNNISLIGGLRAIRTSGEVALFNGYRMSTDKATDYGYVIGVSWEKPEIAARVALTYNSAVTHDLQSNENGVPTSFETEIPQSLNLEFQTGVAKNTLVFGSIRWVDWSAFQIAPPGYVNAASNLFKDALVSYEDDTTTYTLGVGRKFNDTWSGAASLSYEDGNGGYSGNLGPTDGSLALSLAAIYTLDNMKITAGLRYVKIGDAQTEIPSAIGAGAGTCGGADTDCGTFGNFTGNHAVAFGLKVGWSF